MPTLLFADRDALRLALASGGLPADLTGAPARAAVDATGRLWLQPVPDLPREAAAVLGRLGVAILGGDADLFLDPIACWPQLIPLAPADSPPNPAARVLFELPAAKLAQFVAEICRTSPHSVLEYQIEDRQDEHGQVLLRVQRPPLLALLRAGQETNVAAYVEQAPRVWVEAGYRHPLAEQVIPPSGQLALVRAPQQWALCTDGPFEPEVLAFSLPAGPTASERDGAVPIEMPLRLVEGGDDEAAELWIIHERPMEQLAQFAAEAGTAFLARFRAAVAAPKGRSVLLLWAKPSKRPPPAPLLTGLGCRPYLKLANLYLPCGTRLNPPLRREVLHGFACAADVVTSLLPLGEGSWVPVRVPESAFMPLEDCIEHVGPSPRAGFAVSQPRHGLEWELFEEQAIPFRPKADIRSPALAMEVSITAPRSKRVGWLRRLKQRLFARKEPEVIAPPPMKVGEAMRRALPEAAAPRGPGAGEHRDDLHDRRAKLETRFLQALDHHDSDAELLPELAGLHAQQGNSADAAICWLNALWEKDDAPDYWLWGWLQSEKKLSRLLFGENDLPQLIETPPSPASVRLLAASVVRLARQQPELLNGQLGQARLALEAHEDWLPVRAAWLAQVELTRAAQGDALALARARDRLSGRLMQHGLSLELDVPAFVRFSGRDAGERFQAVRDWLVKSRDLIHRWADQLMRNRPASYCRAVPEEYPDRDGRCTKAFIDLMLAWGLARLGERSTARQLATDARAALARDADSVLKFLGDAFQYRIDRALENMPPGGPLPADLMAELDHLRRQPDSDRQMFTLYRIDALRRSRILEPNQFVNPYRPPAAGGDARLLDSAAALELATAALSQLPPDLPEALGHLERALEAPGSSLRDRLVEVMQVAEHVPDPLPAVLLLAKTFELAAVRGDAAAAQLLLPRLRSLFRGDGPSFGELAERLYRPSPSADARGPDDLRRLEALPGYCLRDLRRLGLSAEAHDLVVPAVEWVLHNQHINQLRVSQPKSWPSALRAALRLASNWFADHNEDFAVTVLDTARHSLLYLSDVAPRQRTTLACAYATALAQAPPRMALGRFEELFRDLGGLYEEKQTNTHYALLPLNVVDTVVRATLSDHFTLGPAVRSWLEADEFRVRQRMQRDLAAALG